MPPDGDEGGNARPAEGTWTKLGGIAGILGVVVAIVFGVVSLPKDNPSPNGPIGVPTSASAEPVPGTSTAPTPGRTPTSVPTLNADPFVVDFGESVTITGVGFQPGIGLHIRIFHQSISYEVGRDVVADGTGRFTLSKPAVDNQGWCGAGTVAAFVESGSSYEVPAFSDALATSRLSVRC